ncbi:MAG: hypothetical protein GY793_12370 [Proteobacteria bacterium]|nr:hypothetical protein [Pseudomonadota bacterium]
MDIEFIKWMANNSAGFEWIVEKSGLEYLRSPSFLDFFPQDIKDEPSGSIVMKPHFFLETYPLLLLRAIEGVNKISNYQICYSHPFYEVYYTPNNDLNTIYESEVKENPDTAKEKALKYIYEQELKENK